MRKYLIIMLATMFTACSNSGSSDSPAAAAGAGANTVPAKPLVGQLDTSFNSTGIQDTAAFTGLPDSIISLLAYPDGTSILGARIGGSLAVGAVDPSGASVATPISIDCTAVFGVSCHFGYAMVQADGKTVVGYMIDSVPKRVVFARVNANGGLDSTFGVGGISAVLGLIGSAEPFRIVETLDHHLIAVAEFGNSNPQGFSPGVIKLDSSGSLDNTFGTGGVLLVTKLWNSYSLTLNTATNDIYLGGKDSNSPVADLVEHITANGTEDTSFGTSGLTTVGLQANARNDIAFDQVSGKIYVMSNGTGNATDLRVARLSTNGQLDVSFGTSGIAQMTISTSVGVSQYTSSRMLVDALGNVYVLGNISANQFMIAAPTSKFVLSRLTPAGTLDLDFAGTGSLVGTSSNQRMQTMAFGPDGELLLGGETLGYSSFCMMPMMNTCMMTMYMENSSKVTVIKVK